MNTKRLIGMLLISPMKPIASVCAFVALTCGCGSDKRFGPSSLNSLETECNQPTYGPWDQSVNLGPVVNSKFNDQHPGLSQDGLSLYFVSNRPGGFGMND